MAARGEGRPAAGSRPVAAPPRRLALALATLLCFLWQSALLQVHSHPAAWAPVKAASHDGARLARPDPAPADTAESCPICRDLAQVGQAVAPGAPLLWVPVAAVAGPGGTAVARWVRHLRSHRWQSRGPPLSA